MKRLTVYAAVCLFAVFVLAARWHVPFKCEQCRDKFSGEPCLARCVSNWSGGFFCSPECSNCWAEEHPLEYDADGRIINKAGVYWREPFQWDKPVHREPTGPPCKCHAEQPKTAGISGLDSVWLATLTVLGGIAAYAAGNTPQPPQQGGFA